MDEKNDKISRKLDRLVMGIILGGAVGSVLGLTLAPRKGKETREILKKKIVTDNRETIESAKYQWKKGQGFFRWMFRRKANNEPMPKATLEDYENEK